MSESDPRRTAFVLGGGGTFGAAQVGMLRALLEHDIVPDLLVGTSVGALNAAVFGHRPDLSGVDELGELWRSASGRQLFPVRPRAVVLRVTSRRDHLIPSDGMRRWIERCIAFERIEESTVPLHVVATDASTREAVVLSQGPAVPALLATSAIPGVFPAVELGQRMLVDGAIVADLPIEQAVTLGGTDIWALPTILSGAPTGLPKGARGVAARLLRQVMDRRARTERAVGIEVDPTGPGISEGGARERGEGAVGAEGAVVRTLPAVPAHDVPPFDFGHSALLITRSYDLASTWLDRSLAGGRGLRGDRALHGDRRPGGELGLHGEALT